MKHKILQLIPLCKKIQSRINASFTVYLSLDKFPEDHKTLENIDAIITNGAIGAPKTMLDQLPNLKFITVHGVGYDNIDIETVKKRNIKVSIATNVPTADVADMAIALLLCVSRQIILRDQFLRQGGWEKGLFPLQGYSVSHKKVGIMGMGPIGKAIAKRLEAFENEVCYTARHEHHDVSWQFIPSLEDLAKRSDILIIAASGGINSKNAVNQKVIEALGKQGFLINIGRGTTIDQTALIEALQTKKIAGAGLDVFQNEPHVPPSLISLPNVVLTPHSAGATFETSEKTGFKVLHSLEHFFNGEDLLDEIKF
ncbi:2-ketogluconate reductase [Commensalibacter sp. Nvir]|uniref:2-hydroxyacid dehydrogenase n=1 Tax=Commensalibacter sp. Nvir TaxID=3069817 RepID=UPI002D3B179F|nr:2-ketogluconate reductase [Commensalibacter sp. Nvir]